MEQEKPFKTIEVIDSRAGNVCKVACMSCIRGHRTTSCGGQVCRSKILWTIKRPGRPANTCTCPYGRTGKCQCVVAQSACPHRPKKGEKRTVNCRCDEQGRWCCVLETEQWDALMILQKPRADFYASPEAMDAIRLQSGFEEAPPTLSLFEGAPQTVYNLPSTPLPASRLPFGNEGSNSFSTYPSPPTFQTPRFGLMGVGLPMGNEGHESEDVFTWDGFTPVAPRDVPQYTGFTSPDSTTLTDSTIMSTAPTTPSSHMTDHQAQGLPFEPDIQSFEQATMTSPTLERIREDKLMEDYLNYQFPSAICQSCGLHGCNCKSCPALMQSSLDGSWAQCCSRKHARISVPAQRQDQQLPPAPLNQMSELIGFDPNCDMEGLKLGGDRPFPSDADELGLQADMGMMDFDDFVLTDPEPASGCCCGSAR